MNLRQKAKRYKHLYEMTAKKPIDVTFIHAESLEHYCTNGCIPSYTNGFVDHMKMDGILPLDAEINAMKDKLVRDFHKVLLDHVDVKGDHASLDIWLKPVCGR